MLHSIRDIALNIRVTVPNIYRNLRIKDESLPRMPYVSHIIQRQITIMKYLLIVMFLFFILLIPVSIAWTINPIRSEW